MEGLSLIQTILPNRHGNLGIPLAAGQLAFLLTAAVPRFIGHRLTGGNLIEPVQPPAKQFHLIFLYQ